MVMFIIKAKNDFPFDDWGTKGFKKNDVGEIVNSDNLSEVNVLQKVK